MTNSETIKDFEVSAMPHSPAYVYNYLTKTPHVFEDKQAALNHINNFYAKDQGGAVLRSGKTNQVGTV